MKNVSLVEQFTTNGEISLERVDAFGDLTRGEQLAILSRLRSRGSKDNAEFAVVSILVPIVVSLSIALSRIDPLEGPLWARTIALVVVGGAFGLVLAASLGIPLVLRHQRRVNALGWLAAYEDELARRRTLKGREWRRWQATH